MSVCHLFGNAFSDVHLGSEAAHAEVGGVGVDGGAALAAEDLSKLPGQLRGGQRLHLDQSYSSVTTTMLLEAQRMTRSTQAC